MKFRIKLVLIYLVLLALTAPVVIYAFCCGIMWVCLYGVLVVLLTVIISLLVIRELDTRQRRLTCDIAHELRTPLACLQGNLEAMIDGVWAPDTQRLESANDEVRRLASLADDLSLLTEIEWERIKPEKTNFDISGLLAVCAEQFTPAARQKGISIVLKTAPQTIFADYNRTKQVLINIISNAVKYTGSGSVTLGNCGKEVTIEDTGCGIDSESLPHIFERFYRADKSRARTTGGAGVGLTIALALMRAQGGNIKVKSAPGKGAVFKITF